MLLQRAARDAGTDLASSAIDIGAQVELSGAAALIPPSKPTDWKTWLLWTALFAGVGLLAWMAWRLLHNLNVP